MTTKQITLNDGEKINVDDVRIARVGNLYEITKLDYTACLMWADTVEICETVPNDADYTIVCVRAYNKGIYTGFLQFVRHVSE